MEIKVISKYLRMSPRKLRLVVNSVRGKNAVIAKNFLILNPRKGTKMVLSLLNSAISIVKNSEINEEQFAILRAICSDGPRLKRGKPASKGSMMPIVKKQSHLILILSDENSDKSEKSKSKVKNIKTKIRESDGTKG